VLGQGSARWGEDGNAHIADNADVAVNWAMAKRQTRKRPHQEALMIRLKSSSYK